MTFAFSEDQQELRSTAARFLDEKSSSAVVRELMESDTGFDEGTWKQMGDLGWLGMAIPEEYGGVGFGFVEVTVLMEEMGKKLLPAPYLSSIILSANAILNGASDAQKKELLPGIAEGTTRAALAFVEPSGRWDVDGIEVAAAEKGGNWTISGTKSYVVDGHTANLLIVAAKTGKGVSLFSVDPDASGVTRTKLETLDMTRKQAKIDFSVLGRYSLHFHQVRGSMRGSSVIGASIWDSGNRWITVHGTDYLVVRDCVGYNSIGHGFFLEDGTEVFNVFDRNLAVQARGGQVLPNQVLPFDHNDGAGFWWANSFNTFSRNVACECDEYGYRFDVEKTATFDPVLPVPQVDGSLKKVDIRTLPFIRFEDNEAHTMRRHSLNLGGLGSKLKGGVAGVGPDAKHPFIIKNFRVWDAHWSFHTLAPCVMMENFDVRHAEYGFWNQNYDRHAYRGVKLFDVTIDKDFQPKGKPPMEAEFPGALTPVDDLPPITMVTHVSKPVKGKVTVRGTTTDVGTIKKVQVNGVIAKPLQSNFAEWQAVIDAPKGKLNVKAEDEAGNIG